MGFFASGAKEPKKNEGIPSLDFLHKAECRACPLDNARLRNPKMEPTGSKNPEIIILGEAPGEEEDNQGKQFVGRSGQLVRPLIPPEYRDRIAWDNVIRCHPPKNRNPEIIEIECCRKRHIQYIEEVKPKAIIGLGGVSLHWALNQDGISKWRGRRIPIKVGNHQCWFYPTFHPSFLIRKGGGGRSNYKSDNEIAYEFDLKNIFKEVFSKNLSKPVIHTPEEAKEDIVCITGKEPNALRTVINFLKFASQKNWVGLDYETQNTRPYRLDSRILTVSVSTLEQTLAFAWDHPQAGWSKIEREKVHEAWINFLLSPVRKVVHFLAFEMEWTAFFFGKDKLRISPWEDTASQAFILDERAGGSKPGCFALEFLCLQHFGFNLKGVYGKNLNRKALYKEPLTDILPYNGLDAKYHLLLFLEQLFRLEEEGLVKQYQMMLRRVPTLVLSQLKGLPVDFEVNRELSDQYEKRIKLKEKEIQTTKESKQFTQSLGRNFNPYSTKDVGILLEKIIKTSIGRKDDGSYLTDESVLEKVNNQITTFIVEVRKLRKMKSTYIDPLSEGSDIIYPDSLLHTILNSLYAETGRSCVIGSTILKTDLGNFKIQEIGLHLKNKIIKIVTHEGRWKKITGSHFKGWEPMYRFEFNTGQFIICTSEHKFLQGTDWIRAGSVRVGNKLVSEESVSTRNNRSSSAKSVWGKKFNYFSSGRESFCLFFSSLWINIKKNFRFQNTLWLCAEFKILVFPFVWKCFKVCFQQKLLQSNERKSKGKKASICFSKSNFIRGAIQEGSKFRSTFKDIQGKYFYFEKEFNSFWNTRVVSTSSKIYEFFRIRFGFVIVYFTRIKRMFKTGKLLEGYEICRQIIVQFFLSHDFIVPQNKNISRKWRRISIGKIARSLLVYEYWRNDLCYAFDRKKTFSYQTMGISSIWKKTALVSRFLSSDLQYCYRSGWGTARERKRIRSSKRINSFGERNIGFSYLKYSSSNFFKLLFRKDIRTVTVIGIYPVGLQAVWDISVEGDCSYIAHGVVNHNSSEDPNLQNYPKRDGDQRQIRRQISP